MTLLLASKSATRRRMLEAAGVPHEVRGADFDEERVKAGLRAGGADPRSLAAALAESKARHVVADAGDIVLGADQTLERDDGTMFDKPDSRDEAAGQLRSLSGRTHRLHAAAALVVDGALAWQHVESVSLTMRPLGEAFIQDYLDREYAEVRHNVGGYRIEGLGAQLFEHIQGSHFAILGLPLLALLAALRELGALPS